MISDGRSQSENNAGNRQAKMDKKFSPMNPMVVICPRTQVLWVRFFSYDKPDGRVSRWSLSGLEN